MLATKQQQQALFKIFLSGTKLVFKKGELIIHPGEGPTGVFFIEAGIVKAYNISKYGEENLLIIRKSQEIFPLIWAFTSRERNIIYEALENTCVWRIDRQTYLDYVLSHKQVLLPMLDMTMEMYRIHSERIINLEYRTVRERLVSFLLTMSQRFGVKNKDGSILIDVPLKQQDIASAINSARETTSRELVRLERLGLVANGSGKVTLVDLPALRKIL
ncbi:MAG: Crp/Fnr family transcriptional regulator [Candidatus Saccharimonadales bacterium]